MLNLGDLAAANRKPVSVKKEEPLQSAITLMLAHDFSQLPVMSGERHIDGFISWKTIGERFALGERAETVKDCMQSSSDKLLGVDADLLKAVEKVLEHDFVFVKREGVIYGPVTTSDVTAQYKDLTKRFFLVSDIEASVRTIIRSVACLIKSELALPEEEIDFVLNFSETCESKDFEEYKEFLNKYGVVWRLMGFECLSLKVITSLLEEVRNIRNAVMHFHTGCDLDAQVQTLESADKLLKKMSIALSARCVEQ